MDMANLENLFLLKLPELQHNLLHNLLHEGEKRACMKHTLIGMPKGTSYWLVCRQTDIKNYKAQI